MAKFRKEVLKITNDPYLNKKWLMYRHLDYTMPFYLILCLIQMSKLDEGHKRRRLTNPKSKRIPKVRLARLPFY